MDLENFQMANRMVEFFKLGLEPIQLGVRDADAKSKRELFKTTAVTTKAEFPRFPLAVASSGLYQYRMRQLGQTSETLC
ncbi:hypothetical protein SprV_0100233100 [Sparganum proliferum]